jgi:hypothetical protein
VTEEQENMAFVFPQVSQAVWGAFGVGQRNLCEVGDRIHGGRVLDIGSIVERLNRVAAVSVRDKDHGPVLCRLQDRERFLDTVGDDRLGSDIDDSYRGSRV